MTGGSVRGISGSGKGHWREAQVAYPEGLLSRARRLAAREADRYGTDVATEVRRLSEAYTRHREGLAELPATRERYVGGLGFFFARDLPKAISVVDELAARGELPRGEPLRILDLGAGLGTTSLGVAHWAEATSFARRVIIDAVERDAGALDRMRQLTAREPDEATVEGLPRIELRTHAEELGAFLARDAGRYHLVLLGLALNELAPSIDARLALLRAMVGRLEEGGVALVIEPALHETARALMELRDRVASDDAMRIVGPCTHARACPMLAAGPRDWCHVELPLELPHEEARIAHAAHLRDVKPTFAWLALGRATDAQADVSLHRVVSRALPSKGKQEIHVCGDGTLRRLAALDRDRIDPPLDALRRGALIALRAEGPLGPTVRLGRDAGLELVTD